MKPRLFPREDAYFDLLEAAAANASEAAGVLVELLEDFTEPEARSSASGTSSTRATGSPRRSSSG